MDYERAFPSKYLKAADLDEKPLAVVISAASMENIGEDHKLVLKFQNQQKGMVCNKTNAKRIARMYGRNTDGWIGKEIILYSAEVDFKGDQVTAIRVRGTKAASEGELDDAIPF